MSDDELQASPDIEVAADPAPQDDDLAAARIKELEAALAAAQATNAALAAEVAELTPPEPDPEPVPVEDPGVTVTCPVCGDTHPAPGGDPDFLIRGISQCSVCGSRIAYGEPSPRIIIEPCPFETKYGPRPGLLIRAQNPITLQDISATKLDPGLAEILVRALTP